MAMKAKKLQPAKVAAIAAVKSTLETSPDYIFADYRGLTVEQLTGLRKQLRAKNCEFKVVKNNFARLAFEELKIDTVAEYLTGPTAIALSKEDSNEVAKIMFDFAKDAPALNVKGAFIEKTVYDRKKIESFSKLPGKKQLIAMIAATINAPVQKLAATLQAYVDKMSAGSAAPETATPAESAPAEKPAESAPAAEAAVEAKAAE